MQPPARAAPAVTQVWSFMAQQRGINLPLVPSAQSGNLRQE